MRPLFVVAAVVCVGLTACIGHRLSPPSGPLSAPLPTVEGQDFAVQVAHREDGLWALEYSVVVKPFFEEVPEAAKSGSGAVAPGERHPIKDLVVAIEGISTFEESAAAAHPIAHLGLRVGYQSDWLAGDVGLAYTAFTFVLAAEIGPRFDVDVSERLGVRGQLDLYGSLPLDEDLGYDWNRGLVGPTSGVTPAPTAGLRARLGFGVNVTRELELRLGVMGGIAVDGRDSPVLEGAFVIGLGGGTRWSL